MIRAARPVGTVQRLTRFAQTAGDLMTSEPATVPLTATLREAASILTARGLAAAPVVNDRGQPVGSISRYDVARCAGRAADSLGRSCDFFDVDDLVSWSSSNRLTSIVPDVPPRIDVRNVMAREVFKIQSDAPAARVVQALLTKHVQRLFVVDDDGRLVGTISAVDVLRNQRR